MINKELTRTWIWHEPRWLPKASCDKSQDVHPFRWEVLFRQPGTGETVSTKIHDRVTINTKKKKISDEEN